MTSMLIANNCTRDNGQFMGDQLCYVKVAYLFAASVPKGSRILMSMSSSNEMHFVWKKFIDTFNVEVIFDNFHPGNNPERWEAWDRWRSERNINGIQFSEYRELYLRIHGAQRQNILCGSERGLGRKNIYEYVYYGQENKPESCLGSDWYDDSLVYHPSLSSERDVYISPHCKTQGNATFTFDFWAQVVHKLIAAGITVTVGYDGYFCPDLEGHPLYRRHWGTHQEWFDEVCKHKIVACGNTATGWVAAACGVPLITMEPHNSVMADHRYRECGLRNLVEVVDGHCLDSMANDMSRVATYVAGRIVEKVNRQLVMTTGCYDILHSGHVRHLERSKALGTRLVVALNSDESVRRLKGPTRPINSQEQRKSVLEALRSVDEVRIFGTDTAEELIRELKPDTLTNGFGHTKVVGQELVESWGGRAVITCTGDAKLEPSTTKILNKTKAADALQVCHLASTVSVNPFPKLKLLADRFLSVAHLAGDIADLGAYRGGTSLVLRRLAPEKQLHVFDTWEGTPYDDPLCHHKKGEWPASLDDCKRFVGDAEYHKGIFPATAIGDSFCFVYVDMDTEQATRDAIAFFWPRMVLGGEMFFDDYGWEPCAGVKKAVDEAFADRLVFQDQYSCVVKHV